ncbi:MAG: hypothetical protein ACLQAT_24765 [Candidatus Binataceae bacterium]
MMTIVLLGLVADLALVPVLKLRAVELRREAESSAMFLTELIEVDDAAGHENICRKLLVDLQQAANPFGSILARKKYDAELLTAACNGPSLLALSAGEAPSGPAVVFRGLTDLIGVVCRRTSGNCEYISCDAWAKILNFQVTLEQECTVRLPFRVRDVDVRLYANPRALIRAKGLRRRSIKTESDGRIKREDQKSDFLDPKPFPSESIVSVPSLAFIVAIVHSPGM